MTILEAINLRKSRRTYLQSSIDKDKINKIEEFIKQYNHLSGLSIKFAEDGSTSFNGLRKSYGMFKNVRSVIILKGNRNDVHLKEKTGYYGELLILEATKLELGTCWVGATFDKKDKIFNLEESEELICIITIGNVAPETSVKENLIHKVTHRKYRALEYFYNSDTNELPQWFIEGIRAIQIAPSANNRQAYRVEYKKDKATIKIEEKSVYDLIDLGIAKAHFEIAANGKFEHGNPAVFAKEI